MPLLSVLRLLGGLISVAVLALAAYLLWSWYSGDVVRDAAGQLVRRRDDWRLWAGLAFLAWSALGRTLVLTLLAKRDVAPTRAVRHGGRVVVAPSGAKLYVEQHGPAEAPAIIFTHGWGMDSTFWNYARQALADRFRVVLWDLPGLGKSARPAGKHVDLRGFASDLAHVIELSGRQKVILVGHSIGGITIQTLIRDMPMMQQRIAGVVLFNTTYTNPLKTMVLSGLATTLQRPVLEPAMRLAIVLNPLLWLMKWQSYLSGSAHMAHRLGFGKYVTRSQLEHTTLLSTRAAPAVLARGDLAMFHWDATDALRGLWVPALVVAGDKDIVTKLEAGQVIAAESDQIELRVVQGVNHMGPMERADLYNQFVADFALRVLPSAGDLRSTARPGSGGAEHPSAESSPLH